MTDVDTPVRQASSSAGTVGSTTAETTPPAGPLLAVCGLGGGTGASTVAYLVALAEAGADRRPVLACDTGGPTAGLACYAGVRAPRSLAAVAEALARDESLSDGLFAEAAPGLRIIARGPQLDRDPVDEPAVTQLLDDAREAHSLTVVDCATLTLPIDRLIARNATHVAWVMSATRGGLRRAGQTLAIIPSDLGGRELLVARHDASGRTPPLAELGSLAAERAAPLILMPHVPDLAESPAGEAIEAAEVTIEAIRGVLAR
jgi:Mrp family chromosome partitioning ATPase